MSLTLVAGLILALAVAFLLFQRKDRSGAEAPPRAAPQPGAKLPADLEAQIAQRTRFWSASDHALFAWLLAEAAADTGLPIERDPLARMRVFEAAEKVRQQLESATEAEVNLPFLGADAKGPKHFVRQVRRGDWTA